MDIRPINDRLAVIRIESESTSPGGIVIPDSAKEKPCKGKVVAVGKGRVLDNGNRLPLEVKPGDVVLFGKYAGTETKHKSEDLVILREEDVLAVIED